MLRRLLAAEKGGKSPGTVFPQALQEGEVALEALHGVEDRLASTPDGTLRGHPAEVRTGRFVNDDPAPSVDVRGRQGGVGDHDVDVDDGLAGAERVFRQVLDGPVGLPAGTAAVAQKGDVPADVVDDEEAAVAPVAYEPSQGGETEVEKTSGSKSGISTKAPAMAGGPAAE